MECFYVQDTFAFCICYWEVKVSFVSLTVNIVSFPLIHAPCDILKIFHLLCIYFILFMFLILPWGVPTRNYYNHLTCILLWPSKNHINHLLVELRNPFLLLKCVLEFFYVNWFSILILLYYAAGLNDLFAKIMKDNYGMDFQYSLVDLLVREGISKRCGYLLQSTD